MRAWLVFAGKLAMSVLGVYLSSTDIGSHFGFKGWAWFIGIIFGVVVLVWHWKPGDRFHVIYTILFLASSALIWAMVYGLVERRFVSSIYGPVFLGGALLGTAHAYFLGASWVRVAVAAPSLFACWYLLAIYTNIEYKMINSVSIWQGLYLLFLFGRWPFGGRSR